MSEFAEVMRNWRRMCDTYTTEDAARCCQGCPMDGRGCGAIYENDNADPEVIVREVQRWAANHPEPVYPTWGEWLQKLYNNTNYAGIFITPIPADIAQKLGIEPKEGT